MSLESFWKRAGKSQKSSTCSSPSSRNPPIEEDVVTPIDDADIESPNDDADVVSPNNDAPINGNGVGKVVASGHPKFRKDDLVTGLLIWAQYAVVENVNLLRKLDSMEFPLSYHLGILGVSGLTAYAGFFKVGKPKKGERIFVSTASGSVGNLVGQYAKLFGCYVVGCAGSTQKVAMLKEKLGFDDAFNYKEESDLKLALQRHFPKGIDIYFDNVGGEMLEAAIENMNPFGRVVVCGVMSQYTDPTKRRAGPNMIT
uniref:Alcohol dehydrogenase-like C-terminal domain-containing protein n=1 Tax=Chenopodium quinoa TaxID=63459 RepID=A0A803LHB6_CHEQI